MITCKQQFINVNNVDYTYKSNSEEVNDVKALTGIDFEADKGQFIVVLGRNGSGKSTLARMLNALLFPDSGTVCIDKMLTSQEELIWEVRKAVGMVFQNPDNQIVGTTVEEDIAFGPENIGINPAEIRKRVDSAMAAVDLTEYAVHAPHHLSGGQKQRVAIAGILAIKPQCIVLDEATSMLDPLGRKEVMTVLQRLNREEGITIIHITHHMDEAISADKVVIMDEGRVVMEGIPEKVFSRVEKLKGLGLDVPQMTELFYELKNEGVDLPPDVMDVGHAFNILIKIFSGEE